MTKPVPAKPGTLLLLLSAVAVLFSACGAKDACDGKICVRVSNQHQEAGAPAEVQFEKPGSMSVGQLSVPVARLGFGESTDWFDPSDGAARECTLLQVVFEARSDSTQPWSSIQTYEFAGQPSCFEQSHKYDLVIR